MKKIATALPSRILFGALLTVGLCATIGAAQAGPAQQADADASAAVAMTTAAEERFNITIVAPKGVKKGKATKATVKMVPKGEWHMNMEFPTSLTLTAAEDVKLSKGKLKAADAKTLDEHKGAEFEVEFTPTKAGKGEVDAKIKFAICIESACSPVTEKRKIKYDAK
jgi:hypothetical protein